MSQSSETPLKTSPPKEEYLPYCGGWRKAYKEAGQRLGYNVTWASGETLLISKDGKHLAYAKIPKEPFLMSKLIEDALNFRQKEIEARQQRRIEETKLRATRTKESKGLRDPYHGKRLGAGMTPLLLAGMAISGLSQERYEEDEDQAQKFIDQMRNTGF